MLYPMKTLKTKDVPVVVPESGGVYIGGHRDCFTVKLLVFCSILIGHIRAFDWW